MHRRRDGKITWAAFLLGLAASGFGAAAVAGSDPGSSTMAWHRKAQRCVRANERVVTSNKRLVAVTRRPKGNLVICVRKTERRETVSTDRSWFPSVALAGGVAAWADIAPELDVNQLTVDRFIGKSLTRNFYTGLHVGGIVVRKNGAVAWIDCDATFDDATGHPRQCRKPGQSSNNSVYAGPSDYETEPGGFTRAKLLDEGADIDPSSLRLKGSRLTWKHGDETRHARLR